MSPVNKLLPAPALFGRLFAVVGVSAPEDAFGPGLVFASCIEINFRADLPCEVNHQKRKGNMTMLDKTSKAIKYESKDQITIQRLQITVEGVKPLLTHNPESMGIVADAARGSRIPSSEDEAEAGVYRLEDGTCGIKGEAFRSSILGAAGAWKGKNRATMKSKLAHIVVIDELVPLRYKDSKPIKEYTIDRRRAIVQRQGIIRSRPRFDEWRATFTLEFDPKLVGDPKMIVDIAADAGNRMGVGDYRPQKNGPFGRYKVIEYRLEE